MSGIRKHWEPFPEPEKVEAKRRRIKDDDTVYYHLGRHCDENRGIIQEVDDGMVGQFKRPRTPVEKTVLQMDDVIKAMAIGAITNAHDPPSFRISYVGGGAAGDNQIVCPNATWSYLCHGYKITPFQIQMTQQSRYDGHTSRREFCEWVNNQQKIDPLFYRKILFSDEAEFWMDGFVSKHNCYYTNSSQEDYELSSRSSHGQKLTVWCGMHAGGIIGPYIFRTEDGANSDYSSVYLQLVKDHLPNHVVINGGTDRFWFQQDEAPSHMLPETFAVLGKMFGNKYISPYGPVNWPSKSCDLTPVNFFLWGYLKGKVYAQMPTTLNELEANIRQALANIAPKMAEHVFRHWKQRIQYVRTNQYYYFDDIITQHPYNDYDCDMK